MEKITRGYETIDAGWAFWGGTRLPMGSFWVHMVDRDKRLSIRIGDAERKMLEALAKRDGLTVSDYVRLSTRRAFAEAFPEQPKKPKRK